MRFFYRAADDAARYLDTIVRLAVLGVATISETDDMTAAELLALLRATARIWRR